MATSSTSVNKLIKTTLSEHLGARFFVTRRSDKLILWMEKFGAQAGVEIDEKWFEKIDSTYGAEVVKELWSKFFEACAGALGFAADRLVTDEQGKTTEPLLPNGAASNGASQ